MKKQQEQRKPGHNGTGQSPKQHRPIGPKKDSVSGEVAQMQPGQGERAGTGQGGTGQGNQGQR